MKKFTAFCMLLSALVIFAGLLLNTGPAHGRSQPNNVQASGILVACDDTQTAVTISSGYAAFPDPGVVGEYLFSIHNSTDYTVGTRRSDPNYEIVNVTGKAVSVFTIVRGAGGTTAATHNEAEHTYAAYLPSYNVIFSDMDVNVINSVLVEGASLTLTSISLNTSPLHTPIPSSDVALAAKFSQTPAFGVNNPTVLAALNAQATQVAATSAAVAAQATQIAGINAKLVLTPTYGVNNPDVVAALVALPTITYNLALIASGGTTIKTLVITP